MASGDVKEDNKDDRYNLIIAYISREFNMSVNDILNLTYGQLSGLLDATLNNEEDEEKIKYTFNEDGDMVFETESDFMEYMKDRGLV